MGSVVGQEYIAKDPERRGGRAIIAGTNFPVSSVANYVLRHGLIPEELVRRFPHLTLAQVHAALAYYYDHREEIDAEIAAVMSEDAIGHAVGHVGAVQLRYDSQVDGFVVIHPEPRQVRPPVGNAPDPAVS